MKLEDFGLAGLGQFSLNDGGRIIAPESVTELRRVEDTEAQAPPGLGLRTRINWMTTQGKNER